MFRSIRRKKIRARSRSFSGMIRPKYSVIRIDEFMNEDLPDKLGDEWLISKSLLDDNVKEFEALTNEISASRLKRLRTFEPQLDLLCTAAKNCKKGICKYLLETNIFDPNEFIMDGTAMHWLVKSNFVSYEESQNWGKIYNAFCDTFDTLVSFNADVNLRDSKGYAPLHYAAMHDNFGAAIILLNHKDTIKELTDSYHSMTALHIASKYASEHVALLLIERLQVPHLTLPDDNKMFPLHHTCKCKVERPTVVKKMLKRLKLFMNQSSLIEILSKKDRFENTLFDLAIKENHLKIIEQLLKINPLFKTLSDQELNLPIHIAAKFNGTLETLELMERFDCISFDVNRNWDNVFHLAACTNKLDFIQDLVNKYESVLHSEINHALNAYNSERQTPLLCAISKGNIDCVDYLIRKQYYDQVDIVVNFEMFRVCIENDQHEMLGYLLRLNKLSFLNPILKDTSNNTILHLMCKKKKHLVFRAFVKHLRQNAIEELIKLVNSKNQNDESVFAVACKQGSLEIVEYLLDFDRSELKYDPLNDRDDQYRTPLHSAAMTKHMRIIELLIENGADVNAQDMFNRIPLHYCCKEGLFEISKLLVEHRSKLNTRDIDNMTPLDYSCRMDYHAIVEFLLENGAVINDINAAHHEHLRDIGQNHNKYSYNCLDIAIEKNQSAVVEVLLTSRPFSEFVISREDQCNKLANLVENMPLSMKILIDEACYDPKTNLYKFELIDDPTYRPTENHPLWLIAQHQQKYLLGHPVIRKLLELKMSRGPRILFWSNLMLYLGFLLLLTFYHVNISAMKSSVPTNETVLVKEQFETWPTPFTFYLTERSQHIFIAFFVIYFSFVSVIVMSQKAYQVSNFGMRTLGSIGHWLEMFCLLFNLIAVMPFSPSSSAFGSLSCLFGWMSFAFYFQSVTIFKLGSYSVALRKTIQNSFKFLPFFFMIYFGFLCTFKIRATFGESYLNNTIGQAIKTINMMIGELDGDDASPFAFADATDVNYIINNLIYIFFVFVMCIIVLDLFIGLEVGEIKTVIDEAETYNAATNMIYILKIQHVTYKIITVVRTLLNHNPNKLPSFMNFQTYREEEAKNVKPPKRADLLNRIENFLISMSHSLKQHIDEQLKQMRELSEQVELIMQQLDLVKRKLHQYNQQYKDPTARTENRESFDYNINLNNFNNNLITESPRRETPI